MMALLADGNILTKLTCSSTDCMSYIISLMDIMTVLYLAFCASFRVTKGVRIFGWIWAAVVIAGTVTVIALHTCLFTLVSALFTALILMALFGVTFESIATSKKENAKAEEKAEEKAAKEAEEKRLAEEQLREALEKGKRVAVMEEKGNITFRDASDLRKEREANQKKGSDE